ncbi:MAG TPA: hypothetical protein VFG15_03050 [Amycolatopsis sp.]|nr:hypothetical protein [Amycolatopsis sp.]
MPATLDRVLLPADIAAAIGITPGAQEFSFTDDYGVTYSGTPSHVTLAALARRDRIRHICPDVPLVPRRIREIAIILIRWFTSPDTERAHATAFTELSPTRVCELVIYLGTCAAPKTLDKVGPATLHHYTGHLLNDPVPSADHPFPQLADMPYRALAGTESTLGAGLQVTATTPSDSREVEVPVRYEATETIAWSGKTSVAVPVDKLNQLLMDPADSLERYLTAVAEHLEFTDSETVEGRDITGRLRLPETPTSSTGLVSQHG